MPKKKRTPRAGRPPLESNGERLTRMTIRLFPRQCKELIRRGGNAAVRAWLDLRET